MSGFKVFIEYIICTTCFGGNTFSCPIGEMNIPIIYTCRRFFTRISAENTKCMITGRDIKCSTVRIGILIVSLGPAHLIRASHLDQIESLIVKMS